MTDRVSCEISGGVADVRLTRPEKMNALDSEMFQAIAAVGERLKSERGLRAVVLSGEGRAFCAGLDLSMFAGLDADTGGPASPSTFNPMAMSPSGLTHQAQQICWVWQELAVPVIAAVHGVAFGGGIQLALGADIRIVVASGGIFSGVEAAQLGLATRVSETPLEDALALASAIAANSPSAVRAAKELVRSAYGGTDPVAQMAEERRVVRTLIGGRDQSEAVAAGLEKRPAVFLDD
jgi:enoyl-CoA hydratase/carnithine racemase